MFYTSLLVARIAVKRVIFLERNYMPSILYVLFASSLSFSSLNVSMLLSAMFVAMGASIGIKSYVFKHLASKQVLTSSFYFGTAILFFPPAVYVAPLIFLILSLFRLRTPDFREFIVAIAGFIFPLVVYFLTLWSFQMDVQGHWLKFCDSITLHDNSLGEIISDKKLSIVHFVFLGVSALLFVLAILKFSKTKQYYKKYSQLGFLFFAIFSFWSLGVMLVSPARGISFLPIVAIPFSIVIPTFFASSRPTFFTNILYALLLLSAIAIHILPYFQGVII